MEDKQKCNEIGGMLDELARNLGCKELGSNCKGVVHTKKCINNILVH